MQKLLLILICLFVSVEVMSEDKVYHCDIYPLHPSADQNDSTEIQMFLDIDKEWFSMTRMDSVEYQRISPMLVFKEFSCDLAFITSAYTVKLDSNTEIDHRYIFQRANRDIKLIKNTWSSLHHSDSKSSQFVGKCHGSFDKYLQLKGCF